MNEQKDRKEDEKNRQPDPGNVDDGGSPFMRGCGIAVGVVALVFFFILGTCFLG